MVSSRFTRSARGPSQTALNATQRSDLLIFLLGIDQGTDTFRSAADEFIDTLAQ
jgi:hypothetical protein